MPALVRDPSVLQLTERDICDADPWLELGDLMSLAALEIHELRDAPFGAVTPQEVNTLRAASLE